MTDLATPEPQPLQAPYSSMAAPDVVVALRSLPRRWEQAFGVTAENAAGSDVADLAWRRPPGPPRQWSALDHARHVGRALRQAAQQVRSVRGADRPELAPPEVVPPLIGTGAHPDALAPVLRELATAARAFADEVEAVPGSAWTRTGVRAGREVDLLTLAREAVREGVEHLHGAGKALRRVRAQEG